ncbi:MAG: cytochrome P450, partial [Myxococcales bacterium]|nr:cytochrome P450 [Myxococcales bacterium]
MAASDPAAFADYDPLSPAVRRDPYPYYAHLRSSAPVKYLPSLEAFAVSRHEDVRRLLMDPELFSSEPLIQIAFGAFNPAPGATYMIAADPPDHSRLRGLVNKAFSRRYVAELRADIAARVERFLVRMEEEREFDFTGTFAAPLPVSVIADMLGVESEMHASFRRWSNNVTAGGNAAALDDAQREE